MRRFIFVAVAGALIATLVAIGLVGTAGGAVKETPAGTVGGGGGGGSVIAPDGERGGGGAGSGGRRAVEEDGQFTSSGGGGGGGTFQTAVKHGGAFDPFFGPTGGRHCTGTVGAETQTCVGTGLKGPTEVRLKGPEEEEK